MEDAKAVPMDTPETSKVRKRQVDAREARLAQALRANLRRRKASDASPTPLSAQAAKDRGD